MEKSGNRKLSRGEELLLAIGACRELPAALTGKAVGSNSYGAALVTRLKEEKKISCRSKDGLKGYVLLKKGREELMERFPEKMLPFHEGKTGWILAKSDPDKRMRLHRMAYAWMAMYGFGADVFPDQFPGGKEKYCTSVLVKRKMAREGGGSRACGVLEADGYGFCVYHTMGSLMKWTRRTEWTFRMRTAQALYGAGQERRLQALILADDLSMLERLLRSDGGIKRELFHLDDAYESYFYLPALEDAQLQYRLLMDAAAEQRLEQRLARMVPAEKGPSFCCWQLDLWQIRRVADQICRSGKGTVICLDYQKEVLQNYLGESIEVLGLKPEKVRSVLEWEKG